MKTYFEIITLTLVVICSCTRLIGQKKKIKSPVEELSISIVKKQLDGYNSRNIKKFLSQYSDSIKVYSFRKGIDINGKEQMEMVYGNLFESNSSSKRKITNTIVNGHTVITNEIITLAKGLTDKVIAIYAIENEKIQEVHYIGAD
ncbi:MAG: hypothetical protein ACFB0A_11165 [Croceivirga sp.]